MPKSRRRPSGTAITGCVRDITSANKAAATHADRHAKGGADPITPESIDAAPGGFGLGLASAPLENGDDVNERHGNGSYAWGSIKPKNAPTLLRSKGDYQYMLEFGTDEGFTQIVGCYIETNPGLICRQAFAKSGGVQFAEWEWINPPMQLGVEYRTTERYLGRPVYCKTVDFGAVPPVNTKKRIGFGGVGGGADHIISWVGHVSMENNSFVLPYDEVGNKIDEPIRSYMTVDGLSLYTNVGRYANNKATAQYTVRYTRKTN